MSTTVNYCIHSSDSPGANCLRKTYLIQYHYILTPCTSEGLQVQPFLNCWLISLLQMLPFCLARCNKLHVCVHWGMQVHMGSVRKILIPHPQMVFREDTAPAPRQVLGEYWSPIQIRLLYIVGFGESNLNFLGVGLCQRTGIKGMSKDRDQRSGQRSLCSFH